jgi:N-acetylglucosamine repressor
MGQVQVLGAAVGVRETRVFSAGLDGTIDPDTVRTLRTPAEYDDIIDGIARGLARLRRPSRKSLGVGVSLPGLVDEQQGRVLFSPNLHQTDGRHIVGDLARATGLKVTGIQESRALCLAERLYGGARDLHDFAVVDITDGVGAGIVVDDRLITGRNGVAGEFGHMTVHPDGPQCGCGNRGCLETFTSERAVARAASAALGRAVTMDDVIRSAGQGDVKVRAVVDAALGWLAVGLAALINGLNPEAVFLTGRILDAGENVLSRLEELTRRRALPVSMQGCRLMRGRGTRDQGAIGAAIERLIAARGPVIGG